MSKQRYHIAEYICDKYISYKIINKIKNTNITPNMITLTNMFLSIITYYLAYRKKVILVGVMLIVYQVLDNLDGNYARETQMTTKLGKKLDIISDVLFYNLIFIFLGLNQVKLWKIFLLITIINLYGVIATYYIVPKIKKIKDFKHFGLKRYFMSKKIILGFDVGTMDFVLFVILPFLNLDFVYNIIIFFWSIDIFYRIIEVNYNEFLEKRGM